MKINGSLVRKAISSVLSCAIVMQIGWGLAAKSVIAAGNGNLGHINVNGSQVSLTSDGAGTAAFVITNEGSGYKITCDSPATDDDAEVIVSSISKLYVNIKGTCYVNANVTATLEFAGTNSTVSVGNTFNCQGITVNDNCSGIIMVSGTLVMDEFNSSDYSSASNRVFFYNNGTLSANSIDITDTSNLSHINRSKYIVNGSFTKGNDDFAGTVIAGSYDARIVSAGGSFKLSIGDTTSTIEGEVDTTARALLGQNTSASFSFPAGETMDVIYYGQTYDFSDFISIDPSSYDGTPYVEYANRNNNSTYFTEAPADIGSYYVHAVVPDYGAYNGSVSSDHAFSIEYIDPREAWFPDTEDKFLNFDNVVNDNYVDGTLLVSPAPGFQVALASGDGSFHDQLAIAYDDIHQNGSFNEDVEFLFRRTADGATTAGIKLGMISPEMEDIVFDEDTPDIRVTSIDGTAASLENGESVHAESVICKVSDTTLKEIYINDTLTYGEDDLADGEEDIQFMYMTNTPITYNIRAVDIFGKESTFEFTLYPPLVEPTLNVTMPSSIRVGDDYAPTVDTNSDGVQTVQYFVQGQTTALAARPTAAGNYSVVVTVGATDTYNSASKTVNFEIWKKTATSGTTITLPGTIYVGDVFEPVITTEHNGTPVITYRYNDLDGMPESAVKPTEAGSYLVLVYLPETDEFYEVSTYQSFRISKRTAEATLSIDETIVTGSQYAPTYSTTSDGASRAVIEYKVQGADDSTYTSVQPSAVGSYTVRYSVPETATYLAVTKTADFTIIKKTADTQVSVPDTVYGVSYTPVLTTDSDGASRAVFEYKRQGADNRTYTTNAPSDVGDYTVRVTVPETDTYYSTTATANFSISRRTPSLSVSVSNPYVGTEYAPSVTTDSDAASSMTVEYKEKAAPDTAYTSVRPTTYGEYMVRVTVPMSGTCVEVSRTAEFKIIYLEAPVVPFELQGDSGNDGYFVSDVEINAPEGYGISATYNGTYTASILYNDTIRVVYLKRTSDNALTAAIPIVNRPKIDTEAPSFASDRDIEDGAVLYGSSIDLTATDKHLKSLTINGVPVDLTAEGSNILTLSPGLGIETFRIVAEDEAGHVTILTFQLAAEWLKSRIIPEDLLIPLSMGEGYNLDEGNWTVNGDDTVYNGGLIIFVNEDGDYTFTRVN